MKILNKEGKEVDSLDLGIVEAGTATYIRLNITAALASGAIHWHAEWFPLTGEGFLEPA